MTSTRTSQRRSSRARTRAEPASVPTTPLAPEQIRALLPPELKHLGDQIVETFAKPPNFNELAAIDQSRVNWGGRYTTYNPSILVTRQGMAVFDDMRTDDQVKAALVFKKMAVMSTGWEVVSPDGEGADDEVTAFVRDQLRDLDGTLDHILTEVLSALDFGFSVGEKVWYKVRKGEHTGRVGLATIRSKKPHDFDFETDEYGALLPDGLIQFRTKRLPTDKFVLFSYQREFSNYYGRSDLESAFRAHWIKRNSYQWLGMLLERFGIPPIFALYQPQGMTKEHVAELLTVIKRIQAATAGALPRKNKDSLELWSPQLAGQATQVFIPALRMFNQDIARAILMPGLLGMTSDGEEGSFARSQTHFDVFLLVVRWLQRQIEQSIMGDQVIRPMVDLNFDVEPGKYPKFRFLPLTEEFQIRIMTAWTQLVQNGAVIPTQEDESHIREVLQFPSRTENSKPLPMPEGPPAGGAPPKSPDGDEGDESPSDDMPEQDMEVGSPQADHTIRQRGDKWVLISGDGKVLGTHDSRAGAEAQERAIESAKHREHYDPNQPRDDQGQWGEGGGGGGDGAGSGSGKGVEGGDAPGGGEQGGKAVKVTGTKHESISQAIEALPDSFMRDAGVDQIEGVDVGRMGKLSKSKGLESMEVKGLYNVKKNTIHINETADSPLTTAHELAHAYYFNKIQKSGGKVNGVSTQDLRRAWAQDMMNAPKDLFQKESYHLSYATTSFDEGFAEISASVLLRGKVKTRGDDDFSGKLTVKKINLLSKAYPRMTKALKQVYGV